MIKLLGLLFMPWCSFFARQCGGGVGAQYVPALVSGLLFAAPFGYAWYAVHGNIYLALIVTVGTYVIHNTGHGTALAMGDDPAVAQGGRKQALSLIVDPICNRFNIPLGTLPYCLLFFAIKGALVGWSLGMYDIPLVVLYPASYYFGYKMGNKYGQIEWFSGACCGGMICLELMGA